MTKGSAIHDEISSGAAFVVLLIAFGLVVLSAIVTTAKYVETHQAEQHPVKTKRAG